MLNQPPVALRYDPSVEELEKDEAETGRGLLETMRKISEKTYEHGGHAIRSVHAKSHGLLQGELEVAGGLPEVLAQGLFAKSASYPVVMRFSTIPGDILDDSVSTPRGLAIKVIGVDGPRLPGSEGDVTQDFVLVNGPAFNSPNAKVFLANLKLLAATTDKIEGVKKVVSAAMRGLQHVIEATTGEDNATVATLGGQLETHILGETFYSQAPLRYGDYIVKVAIAPATPELKALTKQHLKVDGVPNALRQSMVDFFRQNGGEWEVQVQLCTNLHDTPIENAAKTWDEDVSPYITVGKIRVAPQAAWTEARSAAVDDGMSFSVWRGLAAHQPLGSIMRVRKQAYEMGRKFRAEHNGKVIEEPRSAPSLPA